jgi:hypothetical protein
MCPESLPAFSLTRSVGDRMLSGREQGAPGETEDAELRGAR